MFRQSVEVSLVTFTLLPLSWTLRVTTPFRKMGRLLICSDTTSSLPTQPANLRHDPICFACHAWSGHHFSPEFLNIERLSTAGFPQPSNRSSWSQVHNLPHQTVPVWRSWTLRSIRQTRHPSSASGSQKVRGSNGIGFSKCSSLSVATAGIDLSALPSSPNHWGTHKFDFDSRFRRIPSLLSLSSRQHPYPLLITSQDRLYTHCIRTT